ncbi:MAG: hypothetical protein IKL87_07995 [Oscillospiraceae bacterium]|nr:hypothetical protein [Oscillospiraceae bacterium]
MRKHNISRWKAGLCTAVLFSSHTPLTAKAVSYDVTNDGKVTMRDVIVVCHAVEESTASAARAEYDVTGDGLLNVHDIMQILLQLEKHIPITPPPSTGYTLDDICTNADAFRMFAGKYNGDFMNGYGIDGVYGPTYGGKESLIILAILNDGYISDDVIREVFADYSEDDIRNGIIHYYNTRWTFGMLGTDVDFSKYTLDNKLGNRLNDIDDAYRNGNIDSFLYSVIIDPNSEIEIEYLYLPAYAGLLASYDEYGKYCGPEGIDEICMDAWANKICNIAFGTPYTK